MGRKQSKIELFFFNNINIEEIIDKTIEIIAHPRTMIMNADEITCDNTSAIPLFKTISKKKPQRTQLRHKILFLVDLIIRSCRANRDNCIQLHSKRLKDTINEEYSGILAALHELNLINITNTYVIGKQCRIISVINWDISNKIYPNLKVIEYYKKWKALLKKDVKAYSNEINLKVQFIDDKVVIEQEETAIPTEEDKIFYEKYEESLSHLDLKVKKDEAMKYIDSLFSSYNSHRYNYYRHIIESFDRNHLRIQSVDNQFRIYHYLTSLPRRLKNLFNIKYEIDVANSHPLLFSKFLISHYNIDTNILNILYNIKEEEYKGNIHNVSDIICNKLNIKELHVPIDVLEYILITHKGIFWDELSKSSNFSRDEIKKETFKIIFYSKKDTAKFSEFGKEFMSNYPNVFSVISQIKKKTNLPLAMMRLESKLIRKVLDECYKQGIKAVNIHDAIILLDDTPTTVIENIMMDIFKQAQLYPTLHIKDHL